MSRAFYPFVEEGEEKEVTARYAARIAVYDDAAAAPRVVVIDPSDVRSFLEEITSEVSRLAREQGGHIPFMVIREVVENFIHAYFIEPAISILDNGDTIRFADQGPGIKEKDRALEYGTTSATEEMKRYIRGVGSGLPYAQQYLQDHGGSLRIEDNIAGGTIVTISMAQKQPEAAASQQSAGQWPMAPQAAAQYPAAQYQPAQYPMQQTMPQYPMAQQVAAQYPPAQQLQAPYPAGQYPVSQQPQAAYAAAPYPAAPQPEAPQPTTEPAAQPAIKLSARGEQVLAYLARHESVGPKDLVDAYGNSQSTWTRELQLLEQAGVITKRGQKRFLTPMGQTLL